MARKISALGWNARGPLDPGVKKVSEEKFTVLIILLWHGPSPPLAECGEQEKIGTNLEKSRANKFGQI